MLPEGWRATWIRELAEVVRGSSPRPAGDPRYFDGDYLPWITVADVTTDERMHLTSTRTNLTEAGSELTRIIEPGTLVLTNSGATLGVPKITTMRAGANDGIAMLINLHGVSKPYLYYFLQSKTNYLREVVAPGVGQPNLNTELIGSIPIALPPPSEQICIAETLSAWDEAISASERLLTNGRARKNALAAAMLMGKRRIGHFSKQTGFRSTPHGHIPEDWSYPAIAEVASEVNERHVSGQPYPVLSCTKHAGLVDSLAYFKKQVFSKDLSTYKVVPRRTFAYATNHIEEGSIGYQDLYEHGLVSPMYTVFRTTDRVCDGYLYRLLKTERFRQIFEAATNSSVNRRGSLRWNDFKKLRIPLPSIEEQEEIAELLDTADQEIDLLQQQVQKLRQEKTALMQQLLTGKRRVRVPVTAAAEAEPA